MGEIYWITLVLGIIIGLLIKCIWDNNRQVTGIIEIDHSNGLCRFIINNNDILADPKTKKVIFIIEHDAKISEDML